MIWVDRSLLALVVLLSAATLMVGICPVAVQAQEAETSVPVEVNTVMPAEKPEFVYSPAGRRDPFAPLIKQLRRGKVRSKKDKGPLEKYELGQFRLMALLIIEGTPRAMVKAPDGKSYTVKPGDLIGPNGGIVKRIETKIVALDEISGQRIVKSPDRLVIEEIGVDNFTGKEFKDYRYIQM
jgi:Tfp pilus assembly protein PilP